MKLGALVLVIIGHLLSHLLQGPEFGTQSGKSCAPDFHPGDYRLNDAVKMPGITVNELIQINSVVIPVDQNEKRYGVGGEGRTPI